VAAIVGLALGASGLDAAAAPGDAPVEVTVARGDTLARLAKRHGVAVADLRKWNRGRIGKGDMLRLGSKLVVRPAAPGAKAPPSAGQVLKATTGWADAVAVRRGDTLGRVAEREGVALKDLLAWNGLNERSKIKAGQQLVVMRPGPKPRASSVGRPTAGVLRHGERLEGGPGYRLRFPKGAFGLESVLKTIRTCARKTKDAFPGTADVLVGELSRAGGGRFPPHQSHQSGRDADIGYYLAGNRQNATMHRVGPSEVDYAKTWTLLRCMLTVDDVARVYMDRGIQAAMAEWLRQKKTMGEPELARLFAVLGGEEALIQHAKKHDTHLHVRFACDADQPECVEEDGEVVFKL